MKSALFCGQSIFLAGLINLKSFAIYIGYTAVASIKYSGPPLMRTPLLPNNLVLVRMVSFGEREGYIHS